MTLNFAFTSALVGANYFEEDVSDVNWGTYGMGDDSRELYGYGPAGHHDGTISPLDIWGGPRIRDPAEQGGQVAGYTGFFSRVAVSRPGSPFGWGRSQRHACPGREFRVHVIGVTDSYGFRCDAVAVQSAGCSCVGHVYRDRSALPVCVDEFGEGRRLSGGHVRSLRTAMGTGYTMPQLIALLPASWDLSGFSGDLPVVGDWTGDGVAKVGIYRSSTGIWYLDANNNGVFDDPGSTCFQVSCVPAGADYKFNAVGGEPYDLPVAGNWNNMPGVSGFKDCVGVARSIGLDPSGKPVYGNWLLDSNCNGVFEGNGSGPDAFFGFGGLAGDVPVIGNWAGGMTRVGVVRKYAPGGVPLGTHSVGFWMAGTRTLASTRRIIRWT